MRYGATLISVTFYARSHSPSAPEPVPLGPLRSPPANSTAQESADM